MSRPLSARVITLFALAVLAYASYALQLAKLDSTFVKNATSNFAMFDMRFCLSSAPAKSKSQSFGKQTYSAKANALVPFSSSGLVIGQLASAKVGDCFSAKARLSPGFEFSRFFFVAKLLTQPKIVHRADTNAVAWLRARFLSSLRGVDSDSEGLVAGLSIGDTTKLSESLLSDFRVLSLTHLTAVSGTNCAIVLGLTWFVVGRLKFGRSVMTKWPRLVLASAVMLGYLALVGPQPSVLRASAMVLAVLLAKTLGRQISALNALALACGVLIVIDPWLIFDYGFLLSALACIGILVVAPSMAALFKKKFTRLPRWLALGVAVSFAAQLMCFPVLLLLQNGFSTYSIAANLFAEPLVLPITVLGLLSVLGAGIWLPLASFLSFVASIFAIPIILLAHYLSHLPAATGFWPSGGPGLLLASLLSFSILLIAVNARRSFRVFGFASIALVVCIVVALATASSIRLVSWAKSGWFMVSCDVGQGDATVIRSQNEVAVIDVGRDPNRIDVCLKQLQITHINLLQLTHFDLDHVAGLSGALAGRKVDSAMLTPFEDRRPGANDARAMLEQHGISVQLAETGLAGELGDFSWQVLSPHRGAFEAVDSNDGSITMLWRSATVDIITLADLGEKGQIRLRQESNTWFDNQLASVPLVMKVSHHGSADQDPALITALRPVLALISVGKGNSYGHPTAKTLNLLSRIGAVIERTDEHGSISVTQQPGGFGLGFQGEQGKTD